MGVMNFLLPAELSADAARQLTRSYVTAGPDGMPGPTEARIDQNLLTIQRAVRDSGSVHVPWPVNDNGRLILGTGTLVERNPPYHLLVELARGKVNQVRSMASDWECGGLVLTSEVQEKLRLVGREFARTVCCQEALAESEPLAQVTLRDAVQLAEDLVDLYVEQVFAARHQHQPQIDTSLSCSLAAPPDTPELEQRYLESFNSVRVPLIWPMIEAAEGQYRWDATDAVVQWARSHDLGIVVGPIVDFSPHRTPEWLSLWKGDLQGLSNVVLDFLEAALQRYRQDVRVWQLTANTNCPAVLGLAEDDVLWLSARMTELARQLDPTLQLIAGISQPWGEYLVQQNRAYTPFGFADMLMRSRVSVAMIDLEIVMGVQRRGSYDRDSLETSRLLDLYSLLGVPIRVTLGYPSQQSPDSQADPGYPVDAEELRSHEVQAEWTRRFAALSLCKPYIVGCNWCHFADSQPHQFPSCGLVDASGQPKPGLGELAKLRKQHLR